MAESVKEFFEKSDEYRDFALVVEGVKIYIDRHLLSAWSPVLRRVFYPQGAPFEQPEFGMVMQEKKLNEFLRFLCYISPSPHYYSKKITEKNVAVLLGYADEYDVGVLRDHCIEFMLKQLNKQTVADETLIDYLHLATLYRLADLQTQLIPLVAKLSVDKIEEAHNTLSASVLAAVYQAKLLQVTGADGHDSGCNGSGQLPSGVFNCAQCDKSCAMSKGKSVCCSYRVYLPSSAAPEALQQFAFVCGVCNKKCTPKAHGGGQWSSCCGKGFFVFSNCEACRQERSAAAKYPLGFSANLLQKNA